MSLICRCFILLPCRVKCFISLLCGDFLWYKALAEWKKCGHYHQMLTLGREVWDFIFTSDLSISIYPTPYHTHTIPPTTSQGLKLLMENFDIAETSLCTEKLPSCSHQLKLALIIISGKRCQPKSPYLFL